MKFKSSHSDKPGIAIFIILMSLMLISFALKELFQLTNTQAERVRYQYDYLQATYMARSVQNLARFLILADERMASAMGQQKDKASDTLSDIWNTIPATMPVPREFLQAMAAQATGQDSAKTDEEGASASETEDFAKKCDDFFGDFPGNATSQIEDLNRKFNLNDLDEQTGEVFQSLVDLISANQDMMDMLSAKNISPTNLVREIRDYMDQDDIENETNSPEDSVYRSMQLEYGPKNYKFTSLDELKMVPSVDDEIFDFLSRYVNAVYIAQRKIPAKINLNTVSTEVFQALLKGVSEPEKISEDFFKDKEENKTTYNESDAAKKLTDTFGLDSEKMRLKLVTGASDAFRIESIATVNEVEVRLETVVGRGYKKPLDPYSISRLAP